MYAFQDERNVEKICYEQEHIDKVMKIIKSIFPRYFSDFLACGGKTGVWNPPPIALRSLIRQRKSSRFLFT